MIKKYNINDKVKLKNTNMFGKIVRLDKEKVTININNKLLQTNLNNIENYNFKEKKQEINVTFPSNIKTFDNEIMLRHQTKDEALFLLDNFLKEALIYKFETIKIIHGKNGGIIRNAVHDYLKHNKNVESYRLGNYYEGQYGVTIVKLKK